MQLYVMRHAIAAERETWTGPDSERPLTRTGRTRMQLAARGLRRLCREFDAIVSSPLVRAVETAEIVAEAMEHETPVEICPALAPGLEPGAVADFLARYPSTSRVLLVGHEPDLGNYVLHLIGGTRADRLPMRKGAVCLVEIELDGSHVNGPGALVWALTPRILRALAP